MQPDIILAFRVDCLLSPYINHPVPLYPIELKPYFALSELHDPRVWRLCLLLHRLGVEVVGFLDLAQVKEVDC